MKILSRYLFGEYFKLLLVCLITFLVVYLLIDFLGKVDNFIEADVSRGVMFSYFLHKIPYILVQMVPAATLISVIILFCLMKKSNEIIALKASGLNIFNFSKPIVITSVGIGIGVFLLSEIVVPFTSSKSNRLWNIEVEKQDPTRFYGQRQIWYRGTNAIYRLRHFDYQKGLIESPTFYFFDEAFRLIKRIDGRKGTWVGGRWKIEEGILQEATEDGGYALKRFEALHLDLPETPETFVRGEKKPEEMSYWQLKGYAERIREEGYDDTRYLVDMNIKIAFPLVNVILVLIGIPISLGLRRGGTPLAVSIGMGVCVLYLLAIGFSRSLGLSGTLPPMLSAWVANLVFLLFGIYLMMNLES
jgi:lipopolysaccharide export system permease protein